MPKISIATLSPARCIQMRMWNLLSGAAVTSAMRTAPWTSGWLSQYSYSLKSRGPEVFTISTNSNKSSKHPVTMTLTKDIKSSPFVMRVLLDPCCTGTGLISARVADSLGLDIRPATHRGTSTPVGGNFNTIGYVTVPSVMLPVSIITG